MIRVVLADDEHMVRAGVTAILAHDPQIEVVAEVGDGAETVAACRRHRPDVALVDIRMPGVDGLAATGTLRREVPDTAVVILTTFQDDTYIAQALGAGAAGFLLKSGDPRELLAAVHAAADGASYLSPEVARRVVDQLGPDRLARAAAARERVAGLTEREREVLRLLADGLSNAEIARQLYLVEGTVKAHVSAILTALGARNRVQAALTAYEAGLTPRQ